MIDIYWIGMAPDAIYVDFDSPESLVRAYEKLLEYEQWLQTHGGMCEDRIRKVKKAYRELPEMGGKPIAETILQRQLEASTGSDVKYEFLDTIRYEKPTVKTNWLEIANNPLSAQIELLAWMSKKSEEIWSAGWINDLEFYLADDLSLQEEYFDLQRKACGCWVWPDADHLHFQEGRFIPHDLERKI